MYKFKESTFNDDRVLLLNHFLLLQKVIQNPDHINRTINFWPKLVRNFYQSNNVEFEIKLKNKKKNKRVKWYLTEIDLAVLVLSSPLCYYTNVPLDMQNMSFDRFDNRKEYHVDNVVLCTQQANAAKNSLYEGRGIHIDDTSDMIQVRAEIIAEITKQARKRKRKQRRQLSQQLVNQQAIAQYNERIEKLKKEIKKQLRDEEEMLIYWGEMVV